MLSSGPARPTFFVDANPALPPTVRCAPRVRGRELVPPLAMGSRAVRGYGSGVRIRVVASAFGGHVSAIVGACTDKKMIRPAARRGIAFVQNTKFAGVLACFQPPNEPRHSVDNGVEGDLP